MAPDPDTYEIRAEVWNQVVGSMRRAKPNEGCGLLFGRGVAQVFYSVTNVAASPTRFEMDPRELLNRMQWAEDHGLLLEGVVHSHVGGRPVPSRDDIAMAAMYPEAVQVIVGLMPISILVKVYRYKGGGVLAPVAYRVPGSTDTPATREYLSR